MLYLPNSNAVFVHIPKCAGRWVRRAIVVSGIKTMAKGREIATLEEARQEFGQDVQVFTFVRHPLTWYQSYWCDRQFQGWGGDLPIAHDCADNTFEGFVLKVVEKYPGWVGNLYKRYAPTSGSESIRSYWGKLEALPYDLFGMLDFLGEESFDREAARNLPLVNPGAKLPSMRKRVQYSKELRLLVCKSEQEAIDCYQYASNHSLKC